MKQIDFAEFLGCTYSSYNEVERGIKEPSTELLKAIADNIELINITWLLTGEGNMYLPETYAPLIDPINDLINYLEGLKSSLPRED